MGNKFRNCFACRLQVAGGRSESVIHDLSNFAMGVLR